MTRVYQNPDAQVGLRALIVGAGAYPGAKAPDRLVLKDLTSVPPSVLLLARKLLTDWRADLSQPLVSLDLLLSDPAGPATWPGYGAAGEIAAGSPLDAPSRAAIEAALGAVLAGATKDDGLLLLFCGHGVAKDERYFVPGDFGAQLNPWNVLINLDELALALRQEPPRTQWLFWDCCANIPEQILSALGAIGSSPLPRDAGRLSAAVRTHGMLGQFRLASAADGDEAFGVAEAPSRFMEMLVEAVDGAGCDRRIDRKWQVYDAGIRSAIQTYADRTPGLANPGFYRFVVPASTDTPVPMRFRQLPGPPRSILIASSEPRRALKKAALAVTRDGESIQQLPAPQPSAVLHLTLDPEREYQVTATFEDGAVQTRPTFAYLPMAEPVEFAWP
ncbi:MAG: caspase family protein [Caulobacter sp.]|nr:caspase family protein [Caulobacter sp.]